MYIELTFTSTRTGDKTAYLLMLLVPFIDVDVITDRIICLAYELKRAHDLFEAGIVKGNA